MDRFIILERHRAGLTALLAELDLSDDTIRRKVDRYCDDDELAELLENWSSKSPGLSPLLSVIDGHAEDGMRYENNVTVAKCFVSRLKDTANNGFGQADKSDALYDPNHCGIDDILNGFYVIQLLGENLLSIDYRKYGFFDSEQLFYTLGAHISNTLHTRDAREVSHFGVGANGKPVANLYANDINGDFRLYQYDMSEWRLADPYSDESYLPFCVPRLIGRIEGYHSVEGSFLVGLLYFIHCKNIESSVLREFESFIDEVMERGETFGPFGDAGDFDEFLIPNFFLGFEEGRANAIYTQAKNLYRGFLDSDNFTYELILKHAGSEALSRLTITPSMVDDLIRGLFYKVGFGNGRSCIEELEAVVRHYLEHLAHKGLDK